MRYLIVFFTKHSFFFFFVLLECIAFFLLINSRNYQGIVIINSTNQLTGSLNSFYSNIADYFSLKKSNKLLAEENTFLLNTLSSSIRTNDSGYQKIDSVYKYIGAKVISNSTHKRNNYLMLNRGLNDGVEVGMGVVSVHGIVGIVIGVSNHFCSVMSMLHNNSRISALIKKNNQLVNVVWNETNYLYGTVEDIPIHLELSLGDTIITSGNSYIFPENILIGTVLEYYTETGENLNHALISFSTDFNALNYVYIIKNYYHEEILNLQKETENE